MERGAKPAKAKVEARPAVTGKSRKIVDATGPQLKRRLAEALEQHAAISEILQVISASPSDVQPVLDAVAERAAHLCEAPLARVALVDGDVVRAMAEYSLDGTSQVRTVPLPLRRTTLAGRAILDRKTIHHDDIVPLLDSEYPDALNARRLGFRAALAVPLIREGNAYGVILLWRREPGLFSPEQVALVQTFAQQVAIAIDNVRLFNETKESLQQQTATADVLKVISRSAFDLQMVLETLTESACKLCEAETSTMWRPDGDVFKVAAMFGQSPTHEAAIKQRVVKPGRDTCVARTLLEGRTVQIHDAAADPEYNVPDFLTADGNRALVGVPLVRDGAPIGVLVLTRSVARPFTEKQIALATTFADQAVIAIENVRLFKETQEALEQQIATSEILRVISQSPTDVQPVFDTIAAAALKLCAASSVTVFTFDGELIRIAALVNVSPEGAHAVRGFYPRPPGRDNAASRAVLTCSVITIPDVLEDREIAYRDTPVASAFRSVLAVPLMRDGSPIGAISVGRLEPGPFPSKQTVLLQTFADQAVIAIENVRLFNETKEALERQTAISEILRVIANSPGDVRPMLNVVAERAMYLCDAADATIFLHEGDRLRSAARFGNTPTPLEEGKFMPLTRGSVTGRAVIDHAVIHMEDLATASEEEFPLARELQRRSGHRAILSVPLMREDRAIGAITLWRMEARRFTAKQIALVKTFADQAAIAIENVRLFDEVEARTRELSESLQQQTATADVLKVISRSAFDLQKVLDTLTESACKLCDAEAANIWRPDGDGFKVAAMFGHTPEHGAALKQVVNKPGRATCVGRALLEGRTVHIRDAKADPEYNAPGVLAVRGNRAMIGVPMLREGAPIGVLILTRSVARPFTEQQIALATTFADQAVIAIENVRLFNETKEALERQTATSEILRVISQSPTDVRPVFDTIAAAALKLCNASSAVVLTFDGERLQLGALANVSPEGADLLRRRYPMVPGRANAASRAILTRSVVAIPDVLEDPEFEMKVPSVSAGFRSIVSVPLMREGSPIGAITVARPEPGSFPEKQIALLQTFADQAVIAIENVRLFNETKEALEQQTATSEILRVISSSPTDVQPVFDAIVRSAAHLFGRKAALRTVEGEGLRRRARSYIAGDEFHGPDVVPVNTDSLIGRAVLECRALQVADAHALTATPYARRLAFRSLASAPLVRDGVAIGVISVSSPDPGAMSDKQMALLATFADQAVIAIENVRLFKELEAQTKALTRSVGELRALGEVGQAVSSTLDLETVLRTIVSRATTLAGVEGGAIYEYDETTEEFYLRAVDRYADDLVEVLRSRRIRKGEGAVGRLAVVLEPVQVRDITDESIYQSGVREILIRLGYRSLLAVPLLRENHLLGGLVVNRNSAGEFAPQVIDLLKTFATQSALAIQNARLFREIEDKSRQLEVASQHKSEFLANMSHELRTPLNAIIGFSEVLAERMFGEINDKQAEYLSDILESGRHLLSLINDILDLSKIEAGRMELERTTFHLPNVIENALTLVRERAQRHGITLGRTVDERLGMIDADERKVKQVLLNLLSNALKFTPKGGRIDVRATARDDAVEISVTDTGVGIAPEDQATVFEEFRQVGSAAKNVEGTGLGLAISRKFIELHGGRIWVESQVGMGSTFAFTLPLPIEQHVQSA